MSTNMLLDITSVLLLVGDTLAKKTYLNTFFCRLNNTVLRIVNSIF